MVLIDAPSKRNQSYSDRKDTSTMNNEEKILAALEALTAKVDAMDTRLASVDSKVDTLETKLNAIKKDTETILDQTADLTEFKTEISRKVDAALTVVKENTFDITVMKAKKA